MQRILIVDDDQQTRNLIREHLDGAYEVFDTGDPASAFMMTLQREPDAILLDLSIPELSGFELCRILSSLTFAQQTPILIVSGQDARNEAFCKNLGAVEYVKKPIDFERLKEILKTILTTKVRKRWTEVGIQSSVPLLLKGRYKDAKSLEAKAVAETMRSEGFQCTCAATLEGNATFEVFLAGGAELLLGSACIALIEGVAPHQRYQFKFIEDAGRVAGASGLAEP
jgi:CheY-like chemotaxis protein